MTHQPLLISWLVCMLWLVYRHARVPTGGYASIASVLDMPPKWRDDDKMETWFLSETLKCGGPPPAMRASTASTPQAAPTARVLLDLRPMA